VSATGPPKSASLANPVFSTETPQKASSPGPTTVESSQSHEVQNLPKKLATRPNLMADEEFGPDLDIQENLRHGNPRRKSNATKAVSQRVAACRNFRSKRRVCVRSSLS